MPFSPECPVTKGVEGSDGHAQWELYFQKKPGVPFSGGKGVVQSQSCLPLPVAQQLRRRRVSVRCVTLRVSGRAAQTQTILYYVLYGQTAGAAHWLCTKSAVHTGAFLSVGVIIFPPRFWVRFHDRLEVLYTRVKETGVGQKTFGELWRRVAFIVKALRDAGVKKGEKVVGYLPNFPKSIEVEFFFTKTFLP